MESILEILVLWHFWNFKGFFFQILFPEKGSNPMTNQTSKAVFSSSAIKKTSFLPTIATYSKNEKRSIFPGNKKITVHLGEPHKQSFFWISKL